ncbi:ATP-binding protein [Bacillus massiliglaciei]|uniref:ATP-binding protein n=1 Tax=Bacillus massiliglaciei TaxID=1816693 RepID=UPI000B0A8414|nr:ATP-binding protein [Bacillus massiliglaciei]
MKPLLSRILGTKKLQESAAMPVPLTINSLQEHQRGAVVGWIANKLGQLVQIEGCDKGILIYSSFHKTIKKADTENIEDYLLFLAYSLVSWMETNEDVYIKIKEMHLLDTYHKCLLEVYEMLKTDDSLYFNKRPPAEAQISEDVKIWEVYRDVLHASTQRKFLLIKDEEVQSFKGGEVLCHEPVAAKEDIPKVRNIAKEVLINEGLSPSKVSSYVLLISEGITNILKHANYGSLCIVKKESSINIIIEDNGKGFPLKSLPYTTLMAGYSTKKSLGQGFTLMLKIASRVLLRTSSNGSTLILEFTYE